MNSPSTPAAALDLPSLRDMAFVFFYKKRYVTAIFITVIVLAMMIAFFSTPVYKTSGQLLVRPPVDKPLVFGSNVTATAVPYAKDQDINVVIHLLNSDDVLRPAIERYLDAYPPSQSSSGLMAPLIELWEGKDSPETAADAKELDPLQPMIRQVRSRLKTSLLPASPLVEVTLTGRNPKQVTLLLNAILSSYITKHIAVNQVDQGLDFFRSQVEEAEQAYREAAAKLEKKTHDWDIISVERQQLSNLDMITRLQIKESELKQTLTSAQKQFFAYRQAFKDNQFLGFSSAGGAKRAAVEEMEKQLVAISMQLQDMEQRYQPGSEPLRLLKKRYEELKRAMLTQAEVEVDGVEKQLLQMQEEIRTLENENRRLADQSHIVEQLEFEVERRKNNYQLYLDKMEEARISAEKDRQQIANVVIAREATVPTEPWFPNPPLIIMLAIPFGLLLALSGAALAYVSDHSIKVPAELEKHTGIRFLGSLDALSTDHG